MPHDFLMSDDDLRQLVIDSYKQYSPLPPNPTSDEIHAELGRLGLLAEPEDEYGEESLPPLTDEEREAISNRIALSFEGRIIGYRESDWDRD